MRRYRKKRAGQALTEALIVLPILIIMIWGIYRVHSLAFLSTRAQMSARHAAWVGSIAELGGGNSFTTAFLGGAIDDEAAETAGAEVLFLNNSGMTDTILPGTTEGNGFVQVKPQGLWVPGIFRNADNSEFSFTDIVSIGNDFINTLFSRIPILRPFFQNSYAIVSIHSSSYGYDENYQIQRSAYFPNRWDSLYYQSLFNLMLQFGFGGIIADMKDTVEEANNRIKETKKELEEALKDKKKFPEGTPYSYDDFEEYLDQWDSFFDNW